MAFNGLEYLQNLARRLVLEFEVAGHAGTPGLVGAAREHPARAQLERILPGNVGVGSGIVVDSYGGQSKQQDVVIYEKHICPVFTYNDTPEATHFPVEGVIAVGEIKSTLNSATLKDAFEKIASAKALRRRAIAEDNGLGQTLVGYRPYCAAGEYAPTPATEYSQDKNSLDQIFGFVLCGRFGATAQTLTQSALEQWKSKVPTHGVNFIASLDDGLIAPHSLAKNSIVLSPMEADGIVYSDTKEQAFPQLVSLIRIYVRTGRTVSANQLENYFRAPGTSGTPIAVSNRLPLK
ncbi:DUF6602 domain-containing protein [Parvibaculum sp. MBR-TMA-1.3b-4.2]|jgi:hypothetical protein